MKRFFIGFLVLLSMKSIAQELPKNEVKLNILNAIAIASVEVGYEYFVGTNQSLDAEIFFNDRFSYHGKKGGKYNATSIKIGYNYYFDLEGLTGPYVNPFLKQRFGNYKDENGAKTNMNAFIIGIGFGYIWNYNDTFVIAPYANIGRSFSSEVNDKFWAVEPNAGLRIGYRF